MSVELDHPVTIRAGRTVGEFWNGELLVDIAEAPGYARIPVGFDGDPYRELRRVEIGWEIQAALAERRAKDKQAAWERKRDAWFFGTLIVLLALVELVT